MKNIIFIIVSIIVIISLPLSIIIVKNHDYSVKIVKTENENENDKNYKIDKLTKEDHIINDLLNNMNSESLSFFKLKRKDITATAYNNVVAQCDDTPNICAWNDKIRPGIIAVSRNLISEGLGRNKKVYVEGIGVLTVLDKMNKRYQNRIDIFMGKDIKKARQFGVKKLKIYWIE
jgi:3D (Asp-Asp-Asp) domain-containing protein